MRFWPKVVIFGPFQSLSLQGEKILDLPDLTLNVSCIALLGYGCKLATKNIIWGIKMAKYAMLAWKSSFLASFWIPSDEGRKF